MYAVRNLIIPECYYFTLFLGTINPAIFSNISIDCSKELRNLAI